jgi:hypothetical protein
VLITASLENACSAANSAAREYHILEGTGLIEMD